MENYRIYFEDDEKDDVLRILRRSPDVLIDNMNHNSFGITIESDDPETLYLRLVDRIDKEVYCFRKDNRHTWLK